MGSGQPRENAERICGALKQDTEAKCNSESRMAEIKGLEVFGVGTHTDSAGEVEEFTAFDLDGMVDAFNRGIPEVVPVKLGHTSPEFAAQLADELGIPHSALTGENGADGMARLGRVTRLERAQQKLVADLEVADELKPMITDGFFTDVSAELIPGDQAPWMLSAVALLGAERPALKDLGGLKSAVVLGERRQPAKVYTSHIDVKSYQDDTVDPQLMQRVRQALYQLFRSDDDEDEEKRKRRRRQGENQMIEKLKELLGFSEEPTEDAVESEITKLKERAEHAEGLLGKIREALGIGDDADVTEAVGELKAKEGGETRNFQESLEAAVKPYREKVERMEHQSRIAAYREETSKLTGVSGTPDELAEKLVKIEDALGPTEAQATLGQWRETQKFAEASGVLSRIGSASDGSGSPEDHQFETEAKALAEKEGIAYETAFSRLATQKPALFNEYHRAHTAVVN